MSRIGKLPIKIPDGVTVAIDDRHIVVKGKKGTLELMVPPKVLVTSQNAEVIVAVKDPEDRKQRALWGLTQRLVANMVTGVTDGFSKQLEVIGIGYKVAVQGRKLVLSVGYYHPVEYKIPDGIEISVEKNTVIVSGANRQTVGQTAAEIRAIRKPEPYKGKGIKYSDEVLRRKVGKAAAKGE